MGYVSGELTSAVNSPRGSALRAVERSGECVSTRRGAEPPEGRRRTPSPLLLLRRCPAHLATQLPLLVDVLELAVDLPP